ncbi:hypothetical protein BGY98DRAFT_1016470 [Russula aff. rugulosa BPL654]|nr:hypothetical protein BGY98DRAFT_1016470 [Russula aff. rugulosa BPL654]
MESPQSPAKPNTFDIESPAIPLGLTFSFPVEQTARDKGILLTWTKGFSAKNAINKDVVKLLQDAFDRKHLHVKCVALTVGTALSRAYTAGGCVLGAIFGTGTNGAYLEQVANITKLGNHPAAATGGVMMVNTEWGAFDNAREVLPTTPFDSKVDRESINPRFQAYEKFISGMYLGEVTRNLLLALVDAAPKPILFNGKSTERLNKHYGLDTEVLSLVESAEDSDSEKEYAALRDFSTPLVEERMRLQRCIVQEHLGFAPGEVSLRDAASACGVATVALQMGYVLASGRTHGRRLRQLRGNLFMVSMGGAMREALLLLLGEEVEKQVLMGLAKDGSEVGGAHS